MHVLQSRVLLRPADLGRSIEFYEGGVGLTRYREWGEPPDGGGVVYFLGGGFLELTAGGELTDFTGVRLWLQVDDLRAAVAELRNRGIAIEADPEQKPWGLIEASIRDPDGLELVIVETPRSHPLRRRQP